jgi:hypothetical protein
MLRGAELVHSMHKAKNFLAATTLFGEWHPVISGTSKKHNLFLFLTFKQKQVKHLKKKYMKRIGKSIILFVLAGVVLLGYNSCEKDKKHGSGGGDEVKKYLSVNGAEFRAASFPSATANGPQIDNVDGNGSVIEGGSNPVRIYTNDNVSKIIVGVENVSGYYEFSATNKSSAAYYMISIILSTEIPIEEFSIIFAIIDANGRVSERYALPVEVIEVGTGRLQVSLSWDQLNDVDLHLVEPNGEEIYYNNTESENGGLLDLDSNANCNDDGINNENITYSENTVVEAGEYIVRVDFWSACDVVQKTNYIVTARLNGVLISRANLTNPYYGSFEPDEADAGGRGSGVEVMRFTLSASQLKSTESMKIRTIKFPNERVQLSNPEKTGVKK